MLNEFLFTKIEEQDIGNIWFQQDGCTCHTAEATLDILSPVFEQAEAVSVNGDRYRVMLNGFLFTKIEEKATLDVFRPCF